MSRGRKRRRKAALKGAGLELWMKTRDQAKAEGRVSLGGSFDDEMRAAYRPVPRDPAEVKRLAYVCIECGEEGHQRRECPRVQCMLCDEYGHVKVDCHLVVCKLCGEYGHLKTDCHLRDLL